MNRRWEWIILSVRSLNVFEENIGMCDSPCQTSSVVFQMFLRFFFLTRSLIDRCQIVTDTCKNNVSKFVWKPFKSPLSLRKWKCFAEASLLNLHHLYFNYHLLTQKLFSLWKILPYLNHLGSFGKNFVKFKKNKYVIYQLRVSPYGEKLWPRSWNAALGRRIFKNSVTVFHHMDLPAGK